MNSRRICHIVGLLATLALLSTSDIASAATVNIPPVEIYTLTHSYEEDPFEKEASGSDGVAFPCAGDCSGPGFTASIGTGDTIIARFEAPAGKKFVVTRSVAPQQSFILCALWFTGVGDQTSNFSLGIVTFENLTGTPPVSTFAQNGISDNGEAIKVREDFDVVGDFEFTAVTVEFVFANALPSTPRTYMPVGSVCVPSFFCGHSGPIGLPDVTLMSIEDIATCSDVDGDGVVGIGDFLQVLADWGTTCP